MASPKRVMFFTPHLGGAGAERVIAKLLARMDRAVAAPELVLVSRTGPFLADVPADVKVHELRAHRLATSLPFLARKLRQRDPHVFFAAGGANIVASMAHRLARSRSRLVLSERNAVLRPDRSRRALRAELAAKRWTYRRADLVTSVSQGVADQVMSELGVAPERSRTVFNPIVDDAMLAQADEPVDHPWFDDDVPVALAVGRFVENKDYPMLLEAFDQVQRRVPCRLFVLGEGQLKGAIERDVARRGLEDCVHLHGFDKNPFRYMKRAAVLMHASRAEGLPGVHIQTGACGTPVVSTDCDFGPREVIAEPGVDGFLVPVGDAAGLATRTLELLENGELRARMGEAARRSVQRFTTDNVLGNYERALLEDAPTW